MKTPKDPMTKTATPYKKKTMKKSNKKSSTAVEQETSGLPSQRKTVDLTDTNFKNPLPAKVKLEKSEHTISHVENIPVTPEWNRPKLRDQKMMEVETSEITFQKKGNEEEDKWNTFKDVEMLPQIDQFLTNDLIDQYDKTSLVNILCSHQNSEGKTLDSEFVTTWKEEQIKESIQKLRDHEKQKAEKLIEYPDIDSLLEDDTITSLEKKQMIEMVYDHNLFKNNRVNRSTIEVWTTAALRKEIFRIRDALKLKERETKENEEKKKEYMEKADKKISLHKTDNLSTKHSNLRKSKYQQKKIQTNLKQEVMKCWRYSLNFNIPNENKGTNGLKNYFEEIFKEMTSYCEGISLLPWNSDEFSNQITNPSDIPTTITQIKKYFHGARPQDSGGFVFTKIRLGFPIQVDRLTFEEDIKGWCQSRAIRLYEASVQHPDVKSVGWLAYLPRTVNQKKWCQAVTKLYQKKFTFSTEMQIGLTWRALNGQKNIEKSKKIYAMHVESPISMIKTVKKFLRYISHKKLWPLGVRFRMVDEFTGNMKETNKQKHRYLADKHKAFMKQISECNCDQILNLDRIIATSGKTLRSIITEIRDKDDNRRIFASIDERYNDNTTFVATFRPDKKSKAYEFMNSLSTYILYLFPNESDLIGILTIEAIANAKEETYHPTTQTFTTQEDIDLEREIQADLDDDSLDFIMADEVSHPYNFDDTIKLIGGEKLWDLTGETDTLSTMAESKTTISFKENDVIYSEDKSVDSKKTETTDENVKEVNNEEKNKNRDVIKELENEMKKIQAQLTIEKLKQSPPASAEAGKDE